MKKIRLFSILKKIYKLFDKKQKIRFIFIIIIMIISALLAQLTPKSIGWLTDDILAKNEISFSKIIPFLILILVINIINEIIKIVRRLLVEDTGTKTEKKARTLVINSLLMAPLSYFKKNMTGNIHGKLNRCLEGTIKLEKLLFMDFVPAIFNALAAIMIIFTTLPFMLALSMMLVIPIYIFIVLKQLKSQNGIRIELLNQRNQIDGIIVELIRGIEVIRICDSLEIENNRFDNISEILRSKEMKHHKMMSLYDALKFINEAIFTVLIIGVSTYLASKNIISVGNVLTAYLCFTQLLKPLEELHRIFDETQECIVLANDFFDMIEIKPDFSYNNIIDYKYSNNTNNILDINNLTFKYYDNKEKIVLDNFNLNIKKGTFLGIVGPSGCGKTSLIKAICKLEEIEGTIKIDNANIDKLTRKDISNIIALVPQTPFLIAGTIFENIVYGLNREVLIDEVIEASKKAYIFDYINNLEDKFDSYISEGGNNLSGGQRQRIALARIFLRKPKILILDEATSALDNTSEKFVQNEIEKMKKENGTTIIAIAHRLTTLKNCDRIIVLNKGKIEEEGNFNELLDQDGIFNDMYYGRIH